MSKTKKTKILTSAVAVVMAAMLLVGGGTIAYYQDSSKEVTNEFNAYQVNVDIEESGNGQYDIIPGTSQSKDPTVTVEAGVDSYVFLVVDDQTNGLVDYEIDTTVWTSLEGYDNVYYTTVEKSDEAKELGVLVGNKVSYSSSITNEQVEDYLEGGLTLSFTAYAIQKEPFADVLSAYLAATGSTTASDATSLSNALSAGGAVVLSDDVTVSVSGTGSGLVPQMKITSDTYLDLNGETLSIADDSVTGSLSYVPCFITVNSGTLTIDGDGTIDTEAGNNTSYGIDVYGGTVVINSGTFYGAPSAIQVEKGSLIINGGFFDLSATCKEKAPSMSKYLINCINSAYKAGTATVTITGGTFVNFDPSNSAGDDGSYVAEGYKVVSETQDNGDVWYTVVADE